MPRYFFNMRNGHGLVPDDEGTDLQDVEAAQQEAVRSIADLSKDLNLQEGQHRLSIEVTDANQQKVMEVVQTLEVRRTQ